MESCLVRGGRECTGKHTDEGQTPYFQCDCNGLGVTGSPHPLSVSHSSMVCKEVQTASAEKWLLPRWEAINKMKSTHLSFCKQIPEGRNSVTSAPHFLCYGTPDNIVKTSRGWKAPRGNQSIQFTSKCIP